LIDKQTQHLDSAALDSAKVALRQNKLRAPYLSTWVHRKTGSTYTVRMHVILEATLAPHVVYYKKFADPDETWCRPACEFFDGRFKRRDNDGELV
jgi:hypothetical protein